MWTIVGLGNPGKEYENTRHNIAWILLTSLIEECSFPSLHESRPLSGQVAEGALFGVDTRIVLPITFMNNSGAAVKKVPDLSPERLIVVHDEIDLPFGTVRIGKDRGAGGHNGVKSIIQSLGSSDFIRIRVGVGKKNIFGILRRPKGNALSNFVLGELTKKEVESLSDIKKKVHRAIELLLTKDHQTAMQEINV